MRTSVDIGLRIKEERQRLGMTQEVFAGHIGITKTTQSNYESGKRTPDIEYLLDAEGVGCDTQFILSGKRQEQQEGVGSDSVYIPKYNVKAGAGVGELNEPSAEYEAEMMCFSRAWLAKKNLNPQHLRIIDVRGRSMEGLLSDGDSVLINVLDTKPRSGVAYVIRQADELLVKYCQLLPGGLLRLSSENPQFQPYDIDLEKTPDVVIVGRVVTSIHNW